jgi:hypothetical protein
LERTGELRGTRAADVGLRQISDDYWAFKLLNKYATLVSRT